MSDENRAEIASAAQHVAQHVLQDAAVAVVVRLAGVSMRTTASNSTAEPSDLVAVTRTVLGVLPELRSSMPVMS